MSIQIYGLNKYVFLGYQIRFENIYPDKYVHFTKWPCIKHARIVFDYNLIFLCRWLHNRQRSIRLQILARKFQNLPFLWNCLCGHRIDVGTILWENLNAFLTGPTIWRRGQYTARVTLFTWCFTRQATMNIVGTNELLKVEYANDV